MKKIKFFVTVFMLLFLMSGCEEVEHKTAMETDGEPETSLAEKVDLSAVSAPKEAAVYTAAFFDKGAEETARIFFGSDFEEGETEGPGRVFLHGAGTPKEEKLYVLDSGRAFFGDNCNLGMIGISFGRRGIRFGIDEDGNEYDGYTDLRQEYSNEGRISSGGGTGGQDGAFSDKRERIEEYLEELGAGGYELFAAGTFPARQGKECCLMYFKPVVDGIPVTHMLGNTGGWVWSDGTRTGGRMLYNDRYNIIAENVGVLEADVQVSFLGDELIDIYGPSLINIGRPLKKYPLVPIDDACGKVREHYPAAAGIGGQYTLERAELQYLLVMPDMSVEEKIYLYPVWLFGVRNKGEDRGSDWTYYMVDAVTGEFFSDIPEERLQ